MDYNKVLKDAKRIHRDDEEFYIIISSGCYSSLNLWEYDHYNYQPSDILQHWKFEGKRWRLVEDNMQGMNIFLNYNNLLKSKGFTLNQYPDTSLWELVVENDEAIKRHICKIFNAVIDDFIDATDIHTLILQCTEDYTQCVFYYDCNIWDMETSEFMKCVEKI